MLLDYLAKTGVVELGKLIQIVYVGDDITQIFLKQPVVLFVGLLALASVESLIDCLVCAHDSSNDLLRHDFLEGEDLV